MFELYFKSNYKDRIDESVHRYIYKDDFETSIRKIYIENDKEMTVLVSVTVYVNYYEYQDVENERCLTVRCLVDLENIGNFKVIEIADYEKFKSNNYQLNSQTLLPYIPKGSYDAIADEILNKFFSKEELKGYIQPLDLANRMGLTIQYHKVSNNRSIFGLICFNDCNMKIYDNNVEKEISIKKGTIVIDQEILSEYGCFSSINFTIAHECVHWYIHRKYFSLMKENFRYLNCTNDEFISNNGLSENDFSQMEYQANGIAARILLPTFAIKRDFDELYDEFLIKNNKIRTYERCINSISLKSNVSKEAVKIRLKEIGYKVEGIYEFVDEKYIKSYLHKDILSSDESYSITELDLLKLMLMNKYFSDFTKNNNYLFIDNHLCFNNNKYITKDYKLTDYALEHLDECCVLFKYKRNNKNAITKNSCLLFRANSKGRDFWIDSFKSPQDIICNSSVSFYEEYNKISNTLSRIYNMDIHSALRECREMLNVSRNDLAFKINYTDQTIKSIENDVNRGVSLENILRIALGLNLPKEVIYRLLEIGNISLDNNMSQLNVAYKYIIENGQKLSIEEIDRFLIRVNQPPLFYKKEEYQDK